MLHSFMNPSNREINEHEKVYIVCSGYRSLNTGKFILESASYLDKFIEQNVKHIDYRV